MKTRNSNSMTREEIISSIQEGRNFLAYLEDMYEGYRMAGSNEVNFEEAAKEIEEVKEVIKNLMEDLSKKVEYKGCFSNEIIVDGRHMFLDSEELKNRFAFFYQAADSFSPDIYVDAENKQKAGEMMELELISRGIEY